MRPIIKSLFTNDVGKPDGLLVRLLLTLIFLLTLYGMSLNASQTQTSAVKNNRSAKAAIPLNKVSGANTPKEQSNIDKAEGTKPATTNTESPNPTSADAAPAEAEPANTTPEFKVAG
jgi:hypothetical protein